MADFRFINPITILPEIGGITIDRTEKLSESYSNSITENPIESSAAVTDHIIRKPTMVSIIGEFVDTPSTNLTGSFTSFLGTSKLKFDALLTLSVKKETFNFMDGVHLFQNFQFENITLIKENSEFSIKFQATLKQIIKRATLGSTFSDLVEREITRAAFIIPALLSTGAISTREVEPFGILL